MEDCCGAGGHALEEVAAYEELVCSRLSFSPVLLRRGSGRAAVWVSGSQPKSAHHSQFSFHVKPQKYWCGAVQSVFYSLLTSLIKIK